MYMAKADMTIVRFLKGWGIYAVGDVAGFSAEEAERLTTGKDPVAVEHDEKAVKSAPENKGAKKGEDK